MNSIDRALAATQSKTDSELARFLGVAQSAIPGYRRRETLPLEQFIKIAERTGVSLDWLILGKGEAKAADVPAEEQMLLTGWRQLPAEKQDYIFDLTRKLARGGSIPAGGVSVAGNSGQTVGGNAGVATGRDIHIQTLNINYPPRTSADGAGRRNRQAAARTHGRLRRKNDRRRVLRHAFEQPNQQGGGLPPET